MEILQVVAGAPFVHLLAALAVPPEAVRAYVQQRAKQAAEAAA